MTGQKNALCSIANYSISRGRLAFGIPKNFCLALDKPLCHKGLLGASAQQFQLLDPQLEIIRWISSVEKHRERYHNRDFLGSW